MQITRTTQIVLRSCSIQFYHSAMPLCSGVWGEVVSWIIPSLLQMLLYSCPVYSPPLSVWTLLTVSFFCQRSQAMYLLKDSVTVWHSLFLRKSTLAKWLVKSSHVIKYLYPPIEMSKGSHISEMMMSPILAGKLSVFWKGALICFPYRQFVHWEIGPWWLCSLRHLAVCSLFMASSME